MIRTSRQLKDLVRKMSKGDSAKAHLIIRTYAMERFLERLSLSAYKRNFILKGGVLVSVMVGRNNRATLDIDASLKHLPLTMESARNMVEVITALPLDDGMTFEIKSVASIMEEDDYPGIRIMLNAMLENMNTPLKLDFSAGDVITPHEIIYSYPLLFENRTIDILAYNAETVVAEKMETILARGTANTRMRDFYDVYALTNVPANPIDPVTVRQAFRNTSEHRGFAALAQDAALILREIQGNAVMAGLWKKYQRKFDYAENVSWDDVMESVKNVADILEHAEGELIGGKE